MRFYKLFLFSCLVVLISFALACNNDSDPQERVAVDIIHPTNEQELSIEKEDDHFLKIFFNFRDEKGPITVKVFESGIDEPVHSIEIPKPEQSFEWNQILKISARGANSKFIVEITACLDENCAESFQKKSFFYLK